LKDNLLVEQVKNGDEEAFKILIRTLEPRIATVVKRMLGDCPEAEDVGQETFVRLYKSIHQFRGDAEIETYVTRIAINLSLNELKRRNRRSLIFVNHETTEFENHSSGSDDLKNEEISSMINFGLSKLKPQFKSVVILRLVSGYSVKETAEILNIAQGTVLSRLARAQRKLKEILSPYLEGNHE